MGLQNSRTWPISSLISWDPVGLEKGGQSVKSTQGQLPGLVEPMLLLLLLLVLFCRMLIEKVWKRRLEIRQERRRNRALGPRGRQKTTEKNKETY